MERNKPENYPFDLRIEELDGENYYVCRFRDFPAVVGAGATADEAIVEGREALAGMLEYYQEIGKTIPLPSVTESIEASGRLTVRMPKSLHAKLIQRSEIEDASLNTLVVQALSEYLERQSKRKSNEEMALKVKKVVLQSLSPEAFTNCFGQDWCEDYNDRLKTETSFWRKTNIQTC